MPHCLLPRHLILDTYQRSESLDIKCYLQIKIFGHVTALAPSSSFHNIPALIHYLQCQELELSWNCEEVATIQIRQRLPIEFLFLSLETFTVSFLYPFNHSFWLIIVNSLIIVFMTVHSSMALSKSEEGGFPGQLCQVWRVHTEG